MCKVLVVGGGPAGLACASALADKGLDVTLYERDDKLGGLLNIIPATRFNPKALEAMVNKIVSKSVKVELGRCVDIANLSSLLDVFDFIFLAVGTQVPVKIQTNAKSMFAVEYLQSKTKANDVAIIGGGNAAMDCAVKAVERGGKATIYYRKARADMKANDKEVEHAQSKGVQFKFNVTDFKNIKCDLAVIAIGQHSAVMPNMLSKRVHAVGDASIGASTIANAIKHAKEVVAKLFP